jgi:putrescine---pyruvate transaminase
VGISLTELIRTDQEHLIHPLHHPIDHSEPVVYVRGSGVVVEDACGRKYLDGLSGLWNVNVGHGRRELADAAAAQMKELAYFSAYAGSSNIPAITLADQLIKIAYNNMQAVFFTCGGAEANEAALKTARFYWRAQGKPTKVKFVARHQGYHGVTLQAMSATSMGTYWKMFEPRVPGFVHIQPCNAYRFQGTKPGETVGQAAARELEEAILREGADTIAAFIGEPIHGAGGVIYPTDDYWGRVREICTRYDILLIADEVITGFGRTGSWFALSHWKVNPDIVSFAKGVTSGYLPLGGILVSRAIKEVMDSVKPEDRWMHAYTYSAHPTCCAVALKNLEIIEREELCSNAEKMGQRLHAGLHSAFGDHPNTGEVRGGKGLLAAVEFVEDRATKRNLAGERRVAPRIQAEMMKRGLVTRTLRAGGAHPALGDAVLFAPPLVITEKEIDQLVSIAWEAAKTALRV